MIQKLLTVLITLAVIFQEAVCWIDYVDIRTARLDVYDSSTITGGVALTSYSLPPTFLVTYTSAISATSSCGIGIVGFQTYTTNQFSVNTTITNFLATGMTITAKALDDTAVTYLSINYIAVGVKAYFVQVQFYCFLPTILSAGNGSRQETKTSTTLFTNQVLLCNVYLSGFRMHNSEGLNNYLNAAVTCPSGSSDLNYVFTTAQNNTVTQICYTTVIFCDACTKGTANYLDWGQIGQTDLSSSILPSTTNINAILNRYEDLDRMFWGINIFNVSRGLVRTFNFQTNYFDITGGTYDTNYAKYANSGTFYISLNHFFIATRKCNLTENEWFQVPTQTCPKNLTCWSNLTYTLNGTQDQYCNYCDITCLTCDGALSTNCTSCDNATFRQKSGTTCPCITGYVEIYQKSCILCSNVITGCSNCISTTVCLNCSSGFTLNMLGICQCTTGFLVTGVCTTLVGCISATNLQGTVYCLSCNTTLNYVRSSNFTCICNSGYYMNFVQDCVSVCGDSVIVKEEGCDDGNSISGDGCNSTCQVQANFYCDNSKSPSVCYIIANITATVKYVQRVLSDNEAAFAIKLDPFYTDYLFMDFGGYISTDLPCTSTKTNYINNLLMVYCWYPYTIQGKNYTLNLTLDTKFFTNGSTISIKLPANGMNAKLTYDTNYALSTPLSMVVVVLDVIAIITLIITSITERMIGVQMIQTLQSVLYTIALTKTCPATLAPLQFLRYTNGYNEIGGTDPAKRYTYVFGISEVGLDQQFLLNYNASYIILVGVIGLMLLLKLIIIKFEKDKARQEQEFNRKFQMEQVHKSYKKVVKVYNFLFQRVFFLLCFMNMFLVIFSMAVQLSNQQSDYLAMDAQFNLLLCGIAACILITFLAMVMINGVYPSTKIFPMFMNPKYPIYYVVYNSTFIILVSFLYNQTWVLFILMAMTLGNLFYSLIYLPYHESIHNLTLAFNQVTIFLALGAYMFEEMTSRTDNNEGIFTILIVVIVAMLYICVVLSIYRLYRFYQFMKLHKLSYHDDNQESKNQDKELITLRANQNDIKIKDKQKDKPDGQANTKALKNYENDYYDNMKMNKNPLNRTNNDINDNIQTKREHSNSSKKRNRDNDEIYDTFSKNNTNNKDSFKINPIDPHPRQIKKDESAYNQYGQVRKTSKDNDEGEYDGLKAIKARLKKDFYHKIRGTQYKQPSKLDLLDKSNEKPANFTPDDLDDEQ